MAFTTANNTRSNNTNGRDDSWKSQGFLNFYLPSRDGGQNKLGAIPLKKSNADEKQLLDALNESDERKARVLGFMLANLEVEYRSVEGNRAGFDLDLGSTTPEDSDGQQDANAANRAQGFLNFYLPGSDGGRKKLGAIPLRRSNGNERDLLHALNESEDRMVRVLKALMAKLEIVYHSAESKRALFNLGEAKAA